jgi:hypothetical protein
MLSNRSLRIALIHDRIALNKSRHLDFFMAGACPIA